MNVIHIASFPPPIGGVSYFLKRLRTYTDNQPFHKTFEYIDVSGVDIENKEKKGIVCKSKIGVMSFLIKHNPSVVVFHSNSAAHLILQLLFEKKHKFIYFTHGESILKEKNCRGWRNRVLKRAEGFVTPTEELYKKVFGMFGDNCSVKYIPFIIYPQIVLPLTNLQINELKKKTGFVFSVYANSLITYKEHDLYGIDMVIELADRLREKGYNAGFIILITTISDIEKFNSYVKPINDRKLNKNIVFINEQLEEASSLYIATNAYLRPTNSDGDSFSIWEALHLGIPVLASDATQRPKGCMLFRNRDIDSMTNKAIELIINYNSIKKTIDDLKIEGSEKEITDYLCAVLEDDLG